jgi:hypothetical protein
VTSIEVKIGAAQRGRGDFENSIGWLEEFWYVSVLDSDLLD